MILIDVDKAFGLTGRQAESALRSCGLTLNRNALPFDRNGPWYTSGLRLGTSAVTTLGMGIDEMRTIAEIIQMVLAASKPATVDGKANLAKVDVDPRVVAQTRAQVESLLSGFPLYPQLDLDIIEPQVSNL
jgi:glycine hydroxymethyltransferase